ncbi:hypothetical protein GCM10023258_33170 [Terrabacter aeriphilus]|uniref:ANTAR domain-containing protein n=1 Tax=Terrabacter aeriphilus TaxID=515662 RepID=A0ABP9JIL3_9MICO
MSDEPAKTDVRLVTDLEELAARVTADEADIEDLRDRVSAGQSDIDDLLGRTDELSRRADASEARADQASRRADASEAAADDDRRDVVALATRVDVDHEVVTRLVQDGVLDRKHAENLAVALRTSRRIGAALGIVMAAHKVDEQEAFEVLRRVSQDTNRKVQSIADDLVRTGDVSELLPSGAVGGALAPSPKAVTH